MQRTLPPFGSEPGQELVRESLLYAASEWVKRLPGATVRAIAQQIESALAQRPAPPKKRVDHDLLDLALLAIVGKYPPLEGVLDEFGIPSVLAVIALNNRKDVPLESLSLVNRALFAHLISELGVAKLMSARVEQFAASRRAVSQGLSLARAKASKQRSKDAEDDKARAREMAADYKRRSPAWGVDDIVAALMRSGQFKRWRAESSYRKAIKGVVTAVQRGRRV